MSDPYKVLGVSRDASMDEIKGAYRNLSRKYHPDANINNPNKDKAEEMFKLIQQAYKQIVDERERGSSYSGGAGYGGYGSSYGGYGGYGYGQRSNADFSNPKMQAAVNFINSRHFQEAMHVLEDVPERTGTWYYLHAMANAGLGNNVEAQADAERAVGMEPNNAEFQRLYQMLSSGGDWYTAMGQGYGYGDPCGGGAMTSCLPCLACSLCSGCFCPCGFCCC